MSLLLSLPEVLLIHIFEYLGINGLKLLSVCSELKNFYGERIEKIAKTLLVQLAVKSKDTIENTREDFLIQKKQINLILTNYMTDNFFYRCDDTFMDILVSSIIRDDLITFQLCSKYPQLCVDPPQLYLNPRKGPVLSSGMTLGECECPQTSLLEIAAIFDSFQVAKLILEQQIAGENAQSHGLGETSRTHIAAWNTSFRTLKLLLDHGGQVNARNSWDVPRISDRNITPLHATLLGPFSRHDYSIETQMKTVECMKLLVDFGARLDVSTGPIGIPKTTGPEFFRGMRCRPCSLSLLHLAVGCQNKPAIQYLLEQGSIEQRLGSENIPNFAIYNDDCDDLYNEATGESNEDSSIDDEDDGDSESEVVKELITLADLDPLPSFELESSEGENKQSDSGGEDLEIFFSELEDVYFLHQVPFRRLYYPRTMAIATAAYLAHLNKDYEIYLEIAFLLLEQQKSINSKLGTIAPNDPSHSEKLFDHLSPYHILASFDSNSRNETLKSQSRIPSCYSSYIHNLLHPFPDDLLTKLELPFHQLNEILKIRLICQNELPIHIFHSLLMIVIVPVRKFYSSLGEFTSITRSEIIEEDVCHALETVISGDQSFFDVLLEAIFSTDLDPPIFSQQTTQSLIEGLETNSMESDFEDLGLFYSSRLLHFLLWTLINETYLSRSRLLLGHYISATLVFQNLADPPITLGEYLWLYLGTISENHQLIEIFFQINEMTDLDMWELSKWTRRSDKTFLAFLVDSLTEKKNFKPADPELLMNSLFDFDFDCSDPRYAAKMTRILYQLDFELEHEYQDETPPISKVRLQKLSWKMGLKLKFSSFQDPDEKVSCRCGDAYQHLRLFSEGLDCYREGLSRLFSSPITVYRHAVVGNEAKSPGSKEKSLSIRCILGMAECHAALGNVDKSFKLFLTGFQILFWHHSILSKIQSLEETIVLELE